MTSTDDALQEALTAEHAMVHALGLLAARTSQSTHPDLLGLLQQAHHDHRGRRDALREFLEERGQDPVAAQATYAVPDWNGVSQVTAAARELERSATAAMTALVARTSDDLRAWALGAAQVSATREIALGGVAQTWPGASELET